MGVMSCPLPTDILLVAGLFLLIFYFYQTWNFTYWKDRNVFYLTPNWFFGNIKDQVLMKSTWRDFNEYCYRAFKDKGFGGCFLFRQPALIVCDPVLVDRILVQDFDHFQDRADWWNPQEDLPRSLYDSQGERWRTLRYNLMPSFSSGKLKSMFNQIFNSVDNVLNKIAHHIESKEPVELDPLIFEYTTDVIASCTFGLQLLTDSLQSRKFKEIVVQLFCLSTLRTILIFYSIVSPKIMSIFFRTIPQSVVQFFTSLTKATIKYRKKNNILRTDFLQLMLTLKEEEETGVLKPSAIGLDVEDDKTIYQQHRVSKHNKMYPEEKVFTEDCIASQMFNFVTVGIRPIVTTISFALFEVARNYSVQKLIQEEIDLTKSKHKSLNFAAFKEMTYLDQVIQETLRVYSTNRVISRVVTDPYKLPGTDIILEKGLPVYIPACAIHADSQYYHAPNLFNPGRFAGNNYKPSPLFLPFGHGPRICIAIRFAVLMMKVCIVRILSKYTVTLSSKMELPLCFQVNEHCGSKGGLWLGFEVREK